MPPKKDAFGTAQQWLKRAKGNLALAKQPKPKEAFWDDLCFDAQQAAEKSIKAVLVHRQIDFPKTHNIRALLELLDPTGSHISKEIWQTIDLTNYAVETRYPGLAEPVTKRTSLEEFMKPVKVETGRVAVKILEKDAFIITAFLH